MTQKILLLLLLNSIYSFSQPNIEWQKCLGGTQSDNSSDIQKTSDGGYIIAGNSSSNNGDVTGNHGGYDYWIVKTNSTGNIEWQKSYGGTNDDTATSIKQTNDGGFIVIGYTNSTNGDVISNHGGDDIWVIKLSNVGVIEWQKCLGGSSGDYAGTILQTTDGAYILNGYTLSNNGDITNNHGAFDIWIVKLNSNGTINWQKTFGGSSSETSLNLQQTIDGGYIFSADTNSNDGDVTGNHGLSDNWIVKLDIVGNIEWQKTFGGTNDEYGSNVQQVADGSYITITSSGSTNGDITATNHGGKDIWVAKLTNTGVIEWQKCIGGSFDDFAQTVKQTSDQGFIIGGYALSNNGDLSINYGNYDAVLFKLNSNGNIEWHKSLGGSGGDYARKILETTDGGCIIAGSSTSTNQDVIGNHGFVDYWLVKLSSILNTNESVFNSFITIYPNPATDKINVKINTNKIGNPYNIYDQSGRIIQSGVLNLENNAIEIGNLSKGIYLFSLDNTLIRKFEKQ